MHGLILLKFVRQVQCGRLRNSENSLPVKSIWGRCLNLIYLSRRNSAADCSFSLNFGTEFGLVTSDVLQTFKVKESDVIIYQQ